MKKIIFTILFASAVLFAAAQKAEKEAVKVPAAVESKFQKDFPSAQNAKWEKEDGNYEVNFKADNATMSAVYDKDGYRNEVETEIAPDQLPPSALDYIHKNLSGVRIMGGSKIVNSKGVVTYEAELDKGGKKSSLLFDAGGKYMKEEKD
jgi:hypothetical protein